MIFLNKNKFIIFLFLIFLLSISLVYFNYPQSTYYSFSTINTNILTSNNINIPLPVPSEISTEIKHLRLDLEKISVHKYYIIYSLIYGNQSHTAYHLLLTDLKFNDLIKSDIKDIKLKTKDQQIIKPIATAIIQDFPQDQPLAWKLKIIVKFPYQSTRDEHQLILNYQDKSYILTKIEY